MTPPIRPKAREDLAVETLDGEIVIYDGQTGALHHLNPTASVVFSLCDGTATIRKLAGELGDAYVLPAEALEGQIRSLLRGFRRAGILEPSHG